MLFRSLLSRGVKALVVACNTATSAAIRILREKYADMPVIGIEPALKPAVHAGGHPRVLVMATPMTLREEKFHALMQRFESDAEILRLPCPGLVEYVEQGVLEGAKAVADKLTAAGLRVKFDDRDNVTPGWKFNEWELKGVPVRVEVGPRDLAEGKVLSVRRDTFEKAPLDIEGLEGEIKAMLDAIQTNMFEIARAFRDEHTADVHSMEELEKQVNGGYAKAMWCGEQACEDEIKDRFGASSRCMPFDQTPIGETCVCCGKPAKKVIYFAKAY